MHKRRPWSDTHCIYVASTSSSSTTLIIIIVVIVIIVIVFIVAIIVVVIIILIQSLCYILVPPLPLLGHLRARRDSIQSQIEHFRRTYYRNQIFYVGKYIVYDLIRKTTTTITITTTASFERSEGNGTGCSIRIWRIIILSGRILIRKVDLIVFFVIIIIGNFLPAVVDDPIHIQVEVV